jgi:hypothetical protein
VAEVRLSKFAIRRVSTELASDFIARVMDEVLFDAYTIASSGPYATGRLAASLRRDGPRSEGFRVVGRVFSNLPYANSVHEGARVHDIFPKAAPKVYRFGYRGRPQLKFFWRRAGHIVFLPHIPGAAGRIGRSHPGISNPKHFLTIPLQAAARRHNMRTDFIA